MDDVTTEVAAYRLTSGQRVKTHRTRQRLSQRALAARVGIGFVTVSELERGMFGPSDPVKFRIARALDVEFDELWCAPTELDMAGVA